MPQITGTSSEPAMNTEEGFGFRRVVFPVDAVLKLRRYLMQSHAGVLAKVFAMAETLAARASKTIFSVLGLLMEGEFLGGAFMAA